MSSALVVVDEPSSPQRPELLATVSQGVRGDYVRAARLLGRLDVDVVLLQHEYGIFGGRDGEYVLSFAQELAQPLVVTLHTVLSEPTPHQLRVLTALCQRGRACDRHDRDRAATAPRARACPDEKIRVVPHGAPVASAQAGGARGGPPPFLRHPVPGGYERMRLALPALHLRADLAGQGARDDDRRSAVDRRTPPRGAVPDRGAHPSAVARREGEQYRLMLERRVVDLGLDDHVEFDDRFLSVDELADLLAATDVFVTPYATASRSRPAR